MVFIVREPTPSLDLGEPWKGRKLPIAAMTGSNVTNGSNGTAATERGCWTIGLINSKYKYLSAETFGHKINANGKALKKKQVWILEPSGDGDTIVMRSHLNKYLAVDQFGNVTCDQDEKDANSKFEISVSDDFSGRWAFKSVVRGYFLGASPDALICSAKTPGDAELWFVHLAARPQLNLFSIGRKRFAHLSDNQDEIRVDENVPWGEDTLFTLEFREEANKYAIHACNNMYLQKDGKLVPSVTKDCYFACEYHGGYIALRDAKGLYLAPIGSRAALKTRSNTVTKDELFSLEDSLPQASFVAASNTRYVSVKQGVDVTANQEEISDHETFQLEFDDMSKRWYMRTMQDKYFTLQPGGGVQANEVRRSKDGLFEMTWCEDGSVAFLANNGKFVGTKKSGHLFANCEKATDPNACYYFYLINRPVLVLKCDQGFVGYKSSASNKLECNKANYEMIVVERTDKGMVYLKGQNGKYLHFSDEGFCANGDEPVPYFIELRDPTRICIKTEAGRYLNSEKNGAIVIGDANAQRATEWEY